MTKLFYALSCLLMCESAFAVVRTDLTRIAVIGDPAPVTNGGGVFFETFRQPMINNAGDVAFEATIDNPVGDLIYKNGIWATDGGVLAERVRAGQVAPGTASAMATFESFNYSTFNDEGQIGFEGIHTGTSFRSGYWINTPIANVPIAVSNTPVIGLDAEYGAIAYKPALNNQGQMAINLAIQETASQSHRYGIFVIDATTVDAVALQGEPAPGTESNIGWIIRTDPPVNESGETAFAIDLIDPNSSTTTSNAIYAGNSESLRLVAQQGMSAAETDANFTSVFTSRAMPINGNGDTVFSSFLQGGTSTTANNEGLWRTRGDELELIVRKGDIAIPATDSTPMLTFSALGKAQPLIDDTGQVVFTAYLSGPGSSITLWSARDEELEMLLQPGMTAPGTNATFTSFSSYAVNRNGQLALRAFTGSTAGLWAQDLAGDLRLIARVGDMVEVAPGETQAITAIDGFTSSGGSDGRSRVINDSGEIVFSATLANGTKGIFTSDAASYYMADFNRDGSVDGDDLTEWQAAYTLGTSAGDADGDGVSNGRDFLIWQRQFGHGSVATLAATVPEPSGFILLVGCACSLAFRRAPL
jgi:hypothetical protein